MVGQTLGHYRILEKIGEGGMGVVYRARDEQLDRDVALKVLPPGVLTDEAARKRFRKEALALAKLNHPHIEAVYEFGSQGGVDFLVMEYAPGVTLAERLAAGALPEKEVLALGAQITAALEEAHEQGVVHRDLKPGNIVVTPKGQAKVLDFGLAKLLRAESEISTTDQLSSTAAGAGTLPYMSPEQLQAKPADARSDIYAAGAVLYEMATGSRPFPGKVGTALVADVLHKPPPPPGRLKHDLSLRLEDIILKCLEKDPENRYQSAKELGVDLRRLAMPSSVTLVATTSARPAWQRAARPAGYGAAGLLVLMAVLVGLNVGGWRGRLLGHAASPRIESLAVLPLENLSRDPEQEYFADGMTEALITDLSKIGALRVISRTSVMRYKGTGKTLPQIARELNVDAVVEGSVQRSGDRVRITAQLIGAPADTHLWAESYDRDLRDVLSLQNEVAIAIVREIRVKVTPQERALSSRARVVGPDVQDLYLRGLVLRDVNDKISLEKSIQCFKQALQKDSGYAPAYAALATVYTFEGYLGILSSRESFQKAEDAARKAVDLDPSLGEAHAALAWIAIRYQWDWPAAERELRQALEVVPNNAQAHHFYSHYLMDMGRTEEGLEEGQRAFELDPLSEIQKNHLIWQYYYARQPDRAIEIGKKFVESGATDPSHYVLLANAYTAKGQLDAAALTLEKAISLATTRTEPQAELARVSALEGKRNEAREILAKLERLPTMQYVSPEEIAGVYCALGEKDRALEWLERAYQERDASMADLKINPAFDPLHGDRRFQDLLHRIGLRQ